MNIALLGLRGIPANYGGFETFAEELAPRLVGRGHKVTVYGRSNNVRYASPFYKGVRLKILPTCSHKYLDTIVHTFLGACHAALFERFDVVILVNAANAPFAFIPRLAGARVALNVDGIERLRKKWGVLGKAYYRLGELLATWLPDVMVADAEVIRRYYLDAHGAESEVIAYGADQRRLPPGPTLERLGVAAEDYILYVTRLEPENNPDLLIRAFAGVDTDKRLLIVGDAPYATAYKQTLRQLAAADPRVILPGAIYGAGYRELISNAYAYVQATEVGGTHPALIEAMAVGNCVIANGTDENREVLGNAGLIYARNDADDLARQLQIVLADPDLRGQLKEQALVRAAQRYSWETVTEQYEALCLRLCGPSVPAGAS